MLLSAVFSIILLNIYTHSHTHFDQSVIGLIYFILELHTYHKLAMDACICVRVCFSMMYGYYEYDFLDMTIHDCVELPVHDEEKSPMGIHNCSSTNIFADMCTCVYLFVCILSYYSCFWLVRLHFTYNFNDI